LKNRVNLYILFSIACQLLFAFMVLEPALCADGSDAATYRDGFPAAVTGDVYGQVKVADVDGDGKNEMVFGATDGMVHIVGVDGKEKRFGLWPKQTGGPILSSVAIGDIKNDGKLRVVVGSLDGKVYCIDKYGKTEWAYDTKGSITFSNPQLYDPDGSQKLKIVVGSTSGRVVKLNENGDVEWQTNAGTAVTSPVKIADLEGNGKKDIIIRDNSGKITVYDEGKVRSGFPQNIGGNTGYWPFELEVADTDRDGKSEIIGQTPEPFSIKAYDLKGTVKFKQDLPAESHSQIRCADINKDGELDMIVTYTYPDDKGAYIDIRTQKGESLPGWPRKVGKYINGIPQIADVDGDGSPDIIFTAWTNDAREKAGLVNVLNIKGEPLQGFPKYIGKSVTPVTICDLDGDGRLDIIAAGGVGLTAPQLHVFKSSTPVPMRILVLGTQYEAY